MQPGVITPNQPVSSPEALAPDELARAAIEARTVLAAAATAAAEAAEQALAVAAALDEALAQLETPDEVSAPESDPPPNQRPLGPLRELSRREQEVLALVARGYTNKNIAETLYVSPNTVKTHVASLLHKLDAETRTQLAAIVTRQEQQRQRPG